MIAALRAHLQRLSKDNESGQALVEFVLVFPVQLLLTLCIIQFAFLAYAHIIVGQAAFQGARAGAVADVHGISEAASDAAFGGATPAEQNKKMDDASAAKVQEMGTRAAARVCALLTSDEEISTPSGRADIKDGQLKWKAEGGSGWRGFEQQRQDQAYALLTQSDTTIEDGYVVCEVKYEYMMVIPIANHFIAPFSQSHGSRKTYGGSKYTTFTIHRVGFVPTPWTTKGIED